MVQDIGALGTAPPLSTTHIHFGLHTARPSLSTQKTGVTEQVTQPVWIFVGEKCSVPICVDSRFEITGRHRRVPKLKDGEAANLGLNRRRAGSCLVWKDDPEGVCRCGGSPQ